MTKKNKQSELIALVDMDGTLADYDKAMFESLQVLRDSRYEPVYDNINAYYDSESPVIKNRMDLIRRDPGWWATLPRLEIGFQILTVLRDFGFHIHILTKGPSSKPHAWSEKVAWAKEHVPGVPVTITEDKGLCYGRILVDDYPDYIIRWLEWRPRGIVIMPANDRNKDFDHKDVVRYDGSNINAVRSAISWARSRD